MLNIWVLITNCSKRLETINAVERAREEKEAARNTLESYILDAQDKLYQADYEKASTEEQRVTIRELCSKVRLPKWYIYIFVNKL